LASSARGTLSRTFVIGLLAALTVGLAACGGSSHRAVTGTVGVSAGVALTTDGDVTSIQVGTTLVITAIVTNDTNNAGVSWTISGVGALSSSSTGGTTYVAPASAVGTVTATITATSIADSTKTAQVTVFVLGTPKIAPVVLFPSNQNVLYSASITVAGGLAPYAWSISSGALPDGITLTASTTSVTSISGTPTTVGTPSTFTITVTDANSASDSITLTLPVNPQTACLLLGRYAFLWSGYFNGSPATYAGSIQIAGDGTLSGIQDWKDSARTTQGEAVTGTCSTAATNTGVLTLNSPNGSGQFTYAVTVPDANGVIHGGRIALINAAENSGSGEITLQDSTAFSASALAGSYAFGAIGDDSAGAHQGFIGRFSVDASGAVSAGRADANGSTPLTAVALTGSLSAPDANGRGIATLSASGQSLVMTYYAVNASKLFIIDTDSGSGTPRLTGYMTRQAAPFDATALTTTTGVLSLWGASGTLVPITSLALGRVANGAVVGGSSGTADLVLDSMNHGVPAPAVAYTAGSYTVASDGRTTYTVSNADGVRSLVLYLDGPADGYVLQQSGKDGLAGTLEAQSGAITDTLAGEFVGGTQFASARAPIDLIPFSELSSGILSSSYATGSYSIDPSTGRGFGTFQQSGVATTVSSMYIVSPTKIDVMRFGTTTGSVENSMEWFRSQ
jgi:hypothetical protein